MVIWSMLLRQHWPTTAFTVKCCIQCKCSLNFPYISTMLLSVEMTKRSDKKKQQKWNFTDWLGLFGLIGDALWWRWCEQNVTDIFLPSTGRWNGPREQDSRGRGHDTFTIVWLFEFTSRHGFYMNRICKIRINALLCLEWNFLSGKHEKYM